MDRENQQSSILSATLRKLDDLERRLRRLESADGPGVLTTWTPVVNQNGGTVAYTSHQCVYERRAGTIWIHMDVVLTANGSGTGAVTVTGLPAAVGEAGQWASLGTFVCYSTGRYSGVVVATGTALGFEEDGVVADWGVSYQLAEGDKISFTAEYVPA